MQPVAARLHGLKKVLHEVTAKPRCAIKLVGLFTSDEFAFVCPPHDPDHK